MFETTHGILEAINSTAEIPITNIILRENLKKLSLDANDLDSSHTAIPIRNKSFGILFKRFRAFNTVNIGSVD